MKKFLLVLVGLFAFPNSICALTCMDNCSETLRTEGFDAVCICHGWEPRRDPGRFYNPLTGKYESCNPSDYACRVGVYDEKRIISYDRTSCSSVIEGCDICYGTEECSSCKRGYTLSNGKCVRVSGYGGGTCPAGQYFNSDEEGCRECPENCAVCNSRGFCTRCNDPYELGEEGKYCQCKYGYAPINGVCEKECQTEVKLEGGVCEEYCAGASEQIDGERIPFSQFRRLCRRARCPDGSTEKFALGAFIKKQSGPFYLTNDRGYWGEMFPYVYCCPENCADCSDWGQCTSCNDGYTLSNGKCVASVSCDSGSVEIGGTCVKAATCTYPLKEVTDYSGECAGCCTD